MSADTSNIIDKATEDKCREAMAQFELGGHEVCDITQHHFGHINDTYFITMKSGGVKRYVLQRINANVFKKPLELLENVKNVTEYLRDIIIKNNGDPDRETLNLIWTKDNNYYYQSGDEYWRLYNFIEGATAYQTVENPAHFYNAGRAFGRFQGLLVGFNAAGLHDTIPDFHNTRKRIETFKSVLAKDTQGRAAEVADEVEFVLARQDEMCQISDALRSGELPVRVTHNDTKFNNVMIDDVTGEGICVIDLDTIMSGSSLFDYGDAIRFGASSAAEDEKDLDKVYVDLKLYELFTRGFLETTKDSLTKKELEMFPLGAKTMTFECGTRFLTDYLDGDNYFKTRYPGHNLDRCRTQFKLVRDMESKWDEMARIISELL